MQSDATELNWTLALPLAHWSVHFSSV